MTHVEPNLSFDIATRAHMYTQYTTQSKHTTTLTLTCQAKIPKGNNNIS